MKKAFYFFIVLFIVWGGLSPAHAKQGDNTAALEQYWQEKELFDTLNNKKNVNASMSHQEYAVVLSHLFGVKAKEVIEITQELSDQEVHPQSVIDHKKAKKVLAELLPSQLEEDFNQLLDTDQPVKRINILQMVDAFIAAYYYKKGDYAGEEINGNAWINHAGVTLSETTIDGDLVITGGKDITLQDVTVSGTVYIHEDMQNEVTTLGSDLNPIVVFNPSKEKSDWSLVWSDEFLANEIDPSRWTYDIGNWIVDEEGQPIAPGWGNNEQQYYTDSDENSYLKDGKLVIEAQKEAEPITDEFGSYDYTSAKLKTKGLFSKKYGKFEARMKLPEGQGFWPAFWMMPEDDVYGPWPTSGEIDIMEAAGNDTSEIGGTIHYGEEYPNNTYSGKEYHFPEGEDYTGYHTYAVEWEPGEIRWYVDGKLYQTQNEWFSKGKNQADKYAFPAPFDQEFYLILNLAVGGWYGGNPDETTEFPGQMEVDYVRVYELTGRDYKDPVEPTVEEETLPEDAKQPLEDGNLIYDQNYERAITVIEHSEAEFHPTDWNFVKLPDFEGEGVITTTEVDGVTFAKTEIEHPGNALWSLQQIQKLPILKGHSYKVTFDAKSDTHRNLMTKVSGGAERGYANYSGEKTMSLTENVHSYDYTFTLNQDTDLGARLEFNMGANGTAPVWIGNVRVEDITDEVAEDTSKPALGDGNLIYNGTFDQGDMTRLNYWELSSENGATAEVSVPESTREAEIAIDTEGEHPEDVVFKQTRIPLQTNKEYELTFNGQASEKRSIQVEIVNEDGTSSYLLVKTVQLTNEMNATTITFQMPKDTSVEEGQLSFLLGGQGGDVHLDDIRLIQTSKAIDEAPLKNGDFSNGMEFWSEYIHFDAQAQASIAGEQLQLDIENAGNETWSVLMEQPNLSLGKEVTYTLSFEARASIARQIELTIENGSYHRYFSEVVSLEEEMQHYEYTFNMTADDIASLKFLMGNFSGQHEIFIDNVKLEVK
ncbi:carbohydrate binding domain-containing protein [Thalassobacillus devorans]|uniref:carbohydrate binding domain-containing protein n=1 Tax=Thalassobacillus devorans TaxID=279813 RepID=UPI00048C37A4|nr:carbohydrate binding domain-containing protein [Thalassobacillus devorans]